MTLSYCGQYVASPSLGSAGGTLEKIAYGIAIPGFIMTSTLWVHLAAKFVRTTSHPGLIRSLIGELVTCPYST